MARVEILEALRGKYRLACLFEIAEVSRGWLLQVAKSS
jgi:hypothetical protein